MLYFTASKHVTLLLTENESPTDTTNHSLL